MLLRRPVPTVLVLALLALGVLAATPLLGHRPSAGSWAGAGSATSGAAGVADGWVPAGVTAFDDGYPAIARLDDDLLAALRDATRDAARDGVQIGVNSGWRSQKYQQQLFEQALATYGSAAAAARWVAPPGTSTHESGHAVDVGPAAATAWLARHGAAYGLCRAYANEAWHFELRPAAETRGCPRPAAR